MDDDLNDDTLLYEMAEAWRKCHSDHPDADTLGRRYGHLKTIAAERMRLASAARPEQVTMTAREFVQWWYDGYPINHDPILIVADPDFYTKHLTPQQDGAE